ncbi:MAG: MBL fold metallo-hydrolase [Rhodobacteraceae bacterium]|nr:MBL fold metallo-hydrolase [Paracoccaceae bacterium]
MRLPLPMKLDHVNVYALRDNDGWCIVDTGFHSKRSERIWQTLLDGPLQGKPINRVLATHHHPDHIGMAGWFQSEHGAELWTTRTAWLFSRMLTLDVQEVWPEETIAFFRRAGMAEEVLQKRLADRPYNFADVVYPMPLGFRRIKQGNVLEIADRTWDVHIGNGHSPEHATLWSRDDGLVLAGDQIIPGISSNIGVYATEPDADPVSDWLEACERFRQIAGDEHFVLPGHKLPFTGLPARMTQLIENHHGALRRLLDHLEHPRTAGECFIPLFKRTLSEAEYGLALVESVAHLNHLHQQGDVSRRRNENGAWEWQRIKG